jgi:hypothetical protein
MAGTLRWNTVRDAQHEAQRQQADQQRARQEEEQRAALKRDLPLFREQLAGAERARAYWAAERDRRKEAEAAAFDAYLRGVHAATGGEVPRAPTGELIVAIDLSGDHPETMAARPAQPQWRAYKQAVDATLEAGHNLYLAEQAIPRAQHNVRVAEQA